MACKDKCLTAGLKTPVVFYQDVVTDDIATGALGSERREVGRALAKVTDPEVSREDEDETSRQMYSNTRTMFRVRYKAAFDDAKSEIEMGGHVYRVVACRRLPDAARPKVLDILTERRDDTHARP